MTYTKRNTSCIAPGNTNKELCDKTSSKPWYDGTECSRCPTRGTCDGTDQFVCRGGSYKTSSGDRCSNCPKNHYSYQGAVGASSCKHADTCKAGSYYDGKYKQCKPCPASKPNSPGGKIKKSACTA